MASAIGNNCVKQLKLMRKDLDSLRDLVASVEASSAAAADGASARPPSTGGSGSGAGSVMSAGEARQALQRATALKGQLAASGATLGRLLDDLELVVKREPAGGSEKADKARARLKDLQAQRRDVVDELTALQARLDDAKTKAERSDLFHTVRLDGRSDTPENPYAATQRRSHEWGNGASNGSGGQARERLSRADGNTRESAALGRMASTLDEYIESGLASLADIRDQGSMLKSTQRKVRDVALKLGVSGETIRWVEQRTRSDKWIFYGGCIFTLFCFYLILKYVG